MVDSSLSAMQKSLSEIQKNIQEEENRKIRALFEAAGPQDRGFSPLWTKEFELLEEAINVAEASISRGPLVDPSKQSFEFAVGEIKRLRLKLAQLATTVNHREGAWKNARKKAACEPKAS
jgi:hypothetical protein